MKTTFYFDVGALPDGRHRYAILDAEMRVVDLQDKRPAGKQDGDEVIELPRPKSIDWSSPFLAAKLGPFTGYSKPRRK